MDELGSWKERQFISTKGTVLLRLNRENEWGKYNIKPIENNSRCSWNLFLADTDLIANFALHIS